MYFLAIMLVTTYRHHPLRAMYRIRVKTVVGSIAAALICSAVLWLGEQPVPYAGPPYAGNCPVYEDVIRSRNEDNFSVFVDADPVACGLSHITDKNSHFPSGDGRVQVIKLCERLLPPSSNVPRVYRWGSKHPRALVPRLIQCPHGDTSPLSASHAVCRVSGTTKEKVSCTLMNGENNIDPWKIDVIRLMPWGEPIIVYWPIPANPFWDLYWDDKKKQARSIGGAIIMTTILVVEIWVLVSLACVVVENMLPGIVGK